MKIKASKEYQQMILDFLEANKVEEFPEVVNVVFCTYIPVDKFPSVVDDAKRALATGLGVDIETVDEVDGGTSEVCISTEINVSRGEDVHAIDFIHYHQDQINSKLKHLNLECAIIVEE